MGKMPCYLLSPQGKQKLEVYENAENESIYRLPGSTLIEGFTFVETVLAEKAKISPLLLQVCHIPKEPGFDYHSIVAMFNDRIIFYNGAANITTIQNCIIVSEQSNILL